MFTLGHVLTRLRQLVTSLICNVKELTLTLLCKLRGVLIAMQTRFVGSLTWLLSPLAVTAQSIKAWRAQFTIQEPSIKQEPINALHLATQLGLQPQQIAPKILQPAIPTQKPKQKHAERTKSGKFARKGTGVAQTLTGKQLTVDGNKQKTHVGLPHQRAKSAPKKGR